MLFLSLLLALPATRCHAQWKKSSDTAQTEIDTITAADEYEDEYETVEEKKDGIDEDTTTVDTAIMLYSRTIPTDTIAAYKAATSFAYMGHLDSLLKVMDEARRRQPPPVEEGSSLWDSAIVKLMCYLVAIGLIGFIIYRLFAGQGLFSFNRKIAAVPATEMEEPANESDLEKALRSAVAKQDYRLGVRYLFLMTLQHLGEEGILQLSSDKTNYQYATELSGKSYANSFARLSLQYEYVWFGDFRINEAQFSTIQQQHRQFAREI